MKSIRILFIGNSFTNRNDLPGMLTDLARSARSSPQVSTQPVIANGMSLRAHWNRGEAQKLITDSSWDYVVLQEQSTLPLKNRARMHESIRLFDTAIKESGARTVLYLTWARQSAFDKQDNLTDAYFTVGRELQALVVPAGVAWQRVLLIHPQITLHDSDGSHPNKLGSYLAACVFYGALFQKSAVSLPGLPGIDADVTKILQEAAGEACKALASKKSAGQSETPAVKKAGNAHPTKTRGTV